MKVVGLRELKKRLAEHVRQVRGGEVVLVTDRGEVVAEIRPPAASGGDVTIDDSLAALARRGLLTPGAPNDPSVYRRFDRPARSGLAGRLLDEERGAR
jgi:antitoxin (DNA-binding transcriptional repressor) of toxin-antitoxin stability system